MIAVTPTLSIDEREIAESFVRASGPGGQNVNKVSSAVRLRFDARQSPSLPPAVRERLEKIAGRRMTQDGVIVISAQRFRTQEANRRDALGRLVALIAAATKVQAERRPTRPTRASKLRRLDAKKVRARIKKGRAEPPAD